MSVRCGIGYDAHRFSSGHLLIIGGVTIPEAERGLAGHSDADVLCHAVADALFGAAGLGDIGEHFPDTDPRYRDAKSTELLADCAALVRSQGFDITAVDATVICEQPKLGPHRQSMRDRLAASMQLGRGSVNLKFSTNEGMGFLGRGEGIAALACATVAGA